MPSKGLLVVLLAAGAFLAGAAISFYGLQTAMIASGPRPASCKPAGFRLPVSLEVMKGIDAAVAVVVFLARIPANRLIASMPFTLQRPVRNLATGALYLGVLAPFPVLPGCPAAPSPGCGPFSRVTVAAVAVLAVACILVYINLGIFTRTRRRHVILRTSPPRED